jgi:hypothetical protein
MKSGQQVHLVFNPELAGTVSAVEADGSVHVTWPQRWMTIDNRTVRLPRQRVRYDAETARKALAS